MGTERRRFCSGRMEKKAAVRRQGLQWCALGEEARYVRMGANRAVHARKIVFNAHE